MRAAAPAWARRPLTRTVASGAGWGLVFAGFVASAALTYRSLYPTAAARDRLAEAFGANHAVSALFGPAPDLQTVAGFTAYKVSMTLEVVGAVWGLLLATRLLRGEEDAGRWELRCVGPAPARRVTATTLAGAAAAVGALFVVTAVGAVATGRSSQVGVGAGRAVLLAVVLVAPAALFVAVGALTSQLGASRRRAATLAAVLLGASYALRLVADAGVGLTWLRWLTPLGWSELAAPLTGPRPVALVPWAVATVVAGGAAVWLAGRRDLGDAVWHERQRGRARTGLLGGPMELAARLSRPVVVGWLVAVAVCGLLFGAVARAAGATLSGSSAGQVLDRLGARGGGTGAYLAVSFLLVSVLVAVAAAGRAGAARTEEATGRLDHLLSRPVGARRWLVGWTALAMGLVVAAGIVGAAATWCGGAAEHAGLRPGPLLAAGLVSVAPAVLVAGAGAAAVGLAPRATTWVTYGLVAWSFLVELAGGFGSASRWVLDASAFHAVAGPPATAAPWTAAGVLVGLGVGLAAIGVVAVGRRDVETG